VQKRFSEIALIARFHMAQPGPVLIQVLYLQIIMGCSAIGKPANREILTAAARGDSSSFHNLFHKPSHAPS
jgi:hypothetical protein